MKGVIGELKRGSFVNFTFDVDATTPKLGILPSQPSNYLPGFYHPIDMPLTKISLTYSTLMNRAVINMHKNLACPKVRIYTNLSTPNDLSVPSFFIEDYIEVDQVVLSIEKRTIKGDKVNLPLAQGKKVDLWQRLFFEQVAPPLIVQVTKSTPVGDIKVTRKQTVYDDF